MWKKAILLMTFPAFLMGLHASSSPALERDVAEIMESMKSALEPSRSSVRDVEMITRVPDGTERTWTGREIRKEVDDRASVALVLLDPVSVRGFAVLAKETADGAHKLWMYSPPVGRVHELVYVGRFQPFLGTELTYTDLGLFDLTEQSFRLLGEEKIDGRDAYRIETVPSDRSVYSRLVTWVAKDTYLPIKREHYDRAGRLWRVARYGAPADEDGIPSIPWIEVTDVQTKYETELRYSKVRFGVALEDELFEPDRLASLPSADVVAMAPGRPAADTVN